MGVLYRMWHTSCSSGDGEVYVFGGSSTPVFTQEEVRIIVLPCSEGDGTTCVSSL